MWLQGGGRTGIFEKKEEEGVRITCQKEEMSSLLSFQKIVGPKLFYLEDLTWMPYT